MRDFTLDGRLSSAAKFVRQGARFADIGTDHAYLPLSLLSEGRIEYAVCSDINRGPLESARANAEALGLSDKVSFHLTDGALGLEDEGITDVAIAGMGGELILDIVSRAHFFKNKDLRLILQPMSRAGILRTGLYQLGFEIEDEEYSESAGKYYVTLCVHYSGEVKKLTPLEAEFGKREQLQTLTDEARGYLNSRRAALVREIRGKKMGGEPTEDADALLTYLNDLLGG